MRVSDLQVLSHSLSFPLVLRSNMVHYAYVLQWWCYTPPSGSWPPQVYEIPVIRTGGHNRDGARLHAGQYRPTGDVHGCLGHGIEMMHGWWFQKRLLVIGTAVHVEEANMDECRIRPSGYIYYHTVMKTRRGIHLYIFQKDNQMVFRFILAVLRWCVQSIRWKTSLYSPVFVVCTGSWGPWPDDPQMAEHRIHFTLTFVLGRPKHITFFFITDEREIYAPEVPGDRHL